MRRLVRLSLSRPEDDDLDAEISYSVVPGDPETGTPESYEDVDVVLERRWTGRLLMRRTMSERLTLTPGSPEYQFFAQYTRERLEAAIECGDCEALEVEGAR